jgi:L-cysteine/cystine lyase
VTREQSFRSQFPVLENCSYLNAGTEGPVPTAAAEAVRRRVEQDTRAGRAGRAYFKEVLDQADKARRAYAELLGAHPSEVALTGSTTDGLNTILGGLRFSRGDEVLTTDQEHPGMLAPLRRLHVRDGVRVRVVPFADIAGEVGASTKLVACSHVSWVNGSLIDAAALRATGVPFLLDAAQGLGAIPVDVKELGCDYYAASGQKWLCGPEGSGCLYVRAGCLDELEPPWPGYSTLSDHDNWLDSPLSEGAGRLDHGFPSSLRSMWALASMQTLADAGWSWVHERAATLAQRLAALLSERGFEVAPRGATTLVSWQVPDSTAAVERLAEHEIVVRNIPGAGLLRASVGAWSSEEELERLTALAAP